MPDFVTNLLLLTNSTVGISSKKSSVTSYMYIYTTTYHSVAEKMFDEQLIQRERIIVAKIYQIWITIFFFFCHLNWSFRKHRHIYLQIFPEDILIYFMFCLIESHFVTESKKK
jgi:hypothetical protein